MHLQSTQWYNINDSVDYLEYAKMMHETFDEDHPASNLEEELRRELTDSHVLKESVFKALFYSRDNPNEFIFSTDHPDYLTIKVHMTWKHETNISFPNIDVVPQLELVNLQGVDQTQHDETQ